MKIDISNFLSTVHPITWVLVAIVFCYGVYKGYIVIKWLNLPNKNDPHLKCPNNKSFNEAITRNIEKTVEIAKIQFVDTLKFQMAEAESVWIEISDILKDNYWKQATKHGLKNGERETAVAYYNLLIDYIKSDVMDILRGWMRSNHFIDKSEVEFQSYTQDKIKRLIPKISDAIDHGFNRTVLKVDMHDLHQSALECMPRIGILAKEFFLKARAISVDMKKLMDKIKEEP